MEGGEPRKDLDTRGDRDDYRGGGKVCPRVHVYPHGEHMVGSDHKPEQGDCPYGVNHPQGAESIAFGGKMI